MNPKFADGYEVLIDYNARTQGMLGNFTQDFLIEVFKDKLNEIKKEQNLEGDFDKIARKCAEKFSDKVEAIRYNDDRGIFAEVKIDPALVDREARGVVKEMVRLGFLTESKGNEKVKASTISVNLVYKEGQVVSGSYTNEKGTTVYTQKQINQINDALNQKGGTGAATKEATKIANAASNTQTKGIGGR